MTLCRTDHLRLDANGWVYRRDDDEESFAGHIEGCLDVPASLDHELERLRDAWRDALSRVELEAELRAVYFNQVL